MWGKIIILALLITPVWAWPRHYKAVETDALAGTEMTVPVVYVDDGDTFIVRDAQGAEQRVRFVDMNATEVSHDGNPAEPFSEEAKARVIALALHKTVKLVIARKGHDKYGRLLADIYLPDGTWLNGEMVKEGLAHVYTFADDSMHPTEMLKLEQEARAAKRGIWSNPRWMVKDAATCCAPEYIGIFQVVQGKPVKVGQGWDGVYIDFGPDSHTDFTVMIEKKDLHNFKAAGIDPVTAYAGHMLRMHGFTDPVEGVEMRVTHPAQIEVVQ